MTSLRVPAAATAVLVMVSAGAAAQETEPVISFQGNQRFELLFRPGQLGVVLSDSAAEEADSAVRTLIGEGFEPVDQRSGIVVLATDEARSPEEILDRADRLEREFPEIVAQAGYVVTFPESSSPLVVTDQIVVQFEEGASQEEAEAFLEQSGVELVRTNPFAKNQFLVSVEPGRDDPLDLANRYNESPLVAFAHPNFVREVQMRQAPVVPLDTFFANQWHHRNTGQNGGTDDADIDSDLAWSLTLGDPATIIAVLDGGFTMNHPDLQGNYFTNPGEIPANGIDEDGNTLVDDVNGWDFTACTATSGPGCGDPDPTGPDTGPGRHGTAVAGAAAAIGNNALGVSGTCPDCTILPVRITLSSSAGAVFEQGLAFGYAQALGAAVITNSWGYPINTGTTANVVAAINAAATNGRGGLGSVVLFAMNNVSVDDCAGATPDISSLASVIGVSRATNQDRFNSGGFGNCMDVLGPTHGGTLWGVTTDMLGTAGYNNNAGSGTCPSAEPAPPPASDRDYTFCFNGTSFAAPVVAGAVGLMLTSEPTLTRQEVQRLLQDTADRVEDSVGAYSDVNGFSTPSSGNATHGYGRVNAFEALRVAAETPAGGRGGVDIMVRDNRLDWGNTEQPSNTLFESPRGYIPHWRSVDIKVDAPPFATMPATAADFEAFAHENPLSGTLNRVYVRVRNRGPDPAETVTLKLHWGFAGAGLPALPPDFWTQFPGDSSDTSIWHPMGVQTVGDLGYSGASVAGTAGDAAQIVSFDFAAPSFDPTLPNPDHYCLFLVIDSEQDPVSPTSTAMLVPDLITPQDNNVTHRNVKLEDSGRDGRHELRFLVHNPFDDKIRTKIRVRAPEGFEIGAVEFPVDRWFALAAGDGKPVHLTVDLPKRFERGTVTVEQVVVRAGREGEQILGGLDFAFAPEGKVAVLLPVDLRRLLDRQQLQVEGFGRMVEKAAASAARSEQDMLPMMQEYSRLLRSQNSLLASVIRTR